MGDRDAIEAHFDATLNSADPDLLLTPAGELRDEGLEGGLSCDVGGVLMHQLWSPSCHFIRGRLMARGGPRRAWQPAGARDWRPGRGLLVR